MKTPEHTPEEPQNDNKLALFWYGRQYAHFVPG